MAGLVEKSYSSPEPLFGVDAGSLELSLPVARLLLFLWVLEEEEGFSVSPVDCDVVPSVEGCSLVR